MIGLFNMIFFFFLILMTILFVISVFIKNSFLRIIVLLIIEAIIVKLFLYSQSGMPDGGGLGAFTMLIIFVGEFTVLGVLTILGIEFYRIIKKPKSKMKKLQEIMLWLAPFLLAALAYFIAWLNH
ncbi:MAG: hypothetical protein JNK24_00665 [Alphaproteobacteria bacterium]|nr:hypothetical protein [Alphaproteobacteria bacterium]